MKKLFGFVAVLTLAAGANAQVVLNPVFEKKVGGAGAEAAPAFFANDNNARSGQLNTASSRAGGVSIIITSLSGGTSVQVINPVSGDAFGTLSTTGVTGGLRAITSVAVDDAGAVYGANLVTSTTGGKVYRWPSDASGVDPTVIADGTFVTTASRFGDVSTARSSGANIAVYVASNTGTARVVAVTSVDSGANWSIAEVGPTRAATGIAATAVGGNLFLKSASANPIEYNQAGTAQTPVTGITATGFQNGTTSGLSFTQFDGKDWLAVGSYAVGSTFRHQALDITNRSAATLEYINPNPTGVSNANTNGTAGVGFAKIGSVISLVGVSTNNIYAHYASNASVTEWDILD